MRTKKTASTVGAKGKAPKAASKKEKTVECCGETSQNCCCSSTGSREDNLQKLAKSNILEKFVKENKGAWDHQKWISLCDCISEKGLEPIDFDQVGLLLEQEKAKYISQN